MFVPTRMLEDSQQPDSAPLMGLRSSQKRHEVADNAGFEIVDEDEQDHVMVTLSLSVCHFLSLDRDIYFT